MAKSVTVNGYTFKEIGAGSVAVSGLGISNGDFGIVVADSVATLSVADLQSLKTVPTVSPGAYAVLSTFTERDVGSIQAGLTNTPPAPTSPVQPAGKPAFPTLRCDSVWSPASFHPGAGYRCKARTLPCAPA